MGICLMIVITLVMGYTKALDTNNIIFVILSQSNPYHLELAENTRHDIYRQAEILQKDKPKVYLSHQDFPHVGDWTILPLIPKLTNLHISNLSWVIILEDLTQVQLNILLEVLDEYDSTENIWIGHAVHDNEPTIIHHFAFFENPQEFKFPSLTSGIALSSALLKSLDERLKQKSGPQQLPDFGIDSSHELALFIWNKGSGQPLTHEPKLCIKENSQCATFPKTLKPCGALVPKNSIYFAVKTCRKYHNDRLDVVKKTWAQHTELIKFFSDIKDRTIPTISLGIPNVEQGHCGKTMAILRYVAKDLERLPHVKWVVLADDDTILGVSRIQKLLSCYDSSISLVIGQRYGYNVHHPNGYNYITGGGGMVFSRKLIKKLTAPGVCECPSISTPDDMYLGLCIASIGVNITHSPLFHQARPVDYPSEYLETNEPVSFHKHWMIDPMKVYEKWFAEDDIKVSKMFHEEL